MSNDLKREIQRSRRGRGVKEKGDKGGDGNTASWGSMEEGGRFPVGGTAADPLTEIPN